MRTNLLRAVARHEYSDRQTMQPDSPRNRSPSLLQIRLEDRSSPSQDSLPQMLANTKSGIYDDINHRRAWLRNARNEFIELSGSGVQFVSFAAGSLRLQTNIYDWILS